VSADGLSSRRQRCQKKKNHGKHGARVEHHQQKDLLRLRRIHPHCALSEDYVGGTGDRQQFGGPLNHRQHRDLKIIGEVHAFRIVGMDAGTSHPPGRETGSLCERAEIFFDKPRRPS
jgi:hypothetical protein